MKNTRQAYAEVLSTETGHGFNENHQRHYQGVEMIRCIAVERAVRIRPQAAGSQGHGGKTKPRNRVATGMGGYGE